MYARAGLAIRYAPAAKLSHKERYATRRNLGEHVRYFTTVRNNLWIMHKHARPIQWVTFWPYFLARYVLVILLMSLYRGDLKSARATLDGIVAFSNERSSRLRSFAGRTNGNDTTTRRRRAASYLHDIRCRFCPAAPTAGLSKRTPRMTSHRASHWRHHAVGFGDPRQNRAKVGHRYPGVQFGSSMNLPLIPKNPQVNNFHWPISGLLRRYE
jgi:hypothetical protein